MHALRQSFLYSAVLLAVSSRSTAASYLDVCNQIASSISNASAVSYPLSLQYTKDNNHWASSSTQDSACSVEPGTAEDVGIILQIVGNYSTPFAVKGGGHTANAGFSSTPGVQIAMSRFSDVIYDESSNTAKIGTGLIWDDVYSTLEEDGVNVVGGRVPGVGVAGFTLGGGYSWLTNQHGLTLDTVTAYELVLPNGTITTVTSNEEDLFFALKGGFNNFGIVTEFTLQTFPQGQVWGGLMTFTGDHFEAIATATANFAQNNTDPKAAIITEFNTVVGLPGVSLNLFYDGPDQPAGIFDEFLSILPATKDIKTRSFADLISATPSDATAGSRGVFHTVSVKSFDKDIIDVILNETKTVGDSLATLFGSGVFISYDVEPFLPSLFTHAAEDSSAYPPTRSTPSYPLNIYYAWEFPTADSSFQTAITESAARIEAVAVAGGVDTSTVGLYGNYAIAGTDLTRIYGEAHLEKLTQIKTKVDPGNVMGLAGGWKFTPSA